MHGDRRPRDQRPGRHLRGSAGDACSAQFVWEGDGPYELVNHAATLASCPKPRRAITFEIPAAQARRRRHPLGVGAEDRHAKTSSGPRWSRSYRIDESTGWSRTQAIQGALLVERDPNDPNRVNVLYRRTSSPAPASSPSWRSSGAIRSWHRPRSPPNLGANGDAGLCPRRPPVDREAGRDRSAVALVRGSTASACAVASTCSRSKGRLSISWADAG